MRSEQHVLTNIAKIGSHQNINTTISMAKSQLNIFELNKYIDKLFQIPFFNRSEIARVPFPQRIENLGSKKIYYSSGDMEKELVWNSRFIFHYSKQINEFIESRDEFNKLILNSAYEEANDFLLYIEKKFGFSYWLIENKIFLLQELHGLEKHKEFVNNIKKENSQVSDMVKYFVSYISVKMEENVTVEKYNLRISEILQNNSDTRLPDHLLDYIKFKLYFKEYFSMDALSTLVYEGNLSIIDRYCTLIRIIRNKRDELSRSATNIIINNLSEINDDQSARIIKKKPSYEILFILDKYTEGDYEKTIEFCSKQLELRPELVDLYPILVRSKLRLGITDNMWHNNSLLSVILEGLKDIYLSTEKFEESYSKLKKITYIFCNNEWSWQLRGLIEEASNNNQANKLVESYRKNVHPENPLSVRTETNNFIEKDEFIELKNENEDSVTLNLYENIIIKDINKVKEMSIPEYRKKSIIASIHKENKNYELAKQLYKDLIDNNNRYTEIKGLQGFVETSIELGDYEDAVELIVNRFLGEKTFAKQINMIKLLDDIQNDIESTERLNKLIDYPILYDIYSKNYSTDRESEKGEAYEEFLLSYDAERPSDLAVKDINIPQHKLIYFLRYVCIESVMDYSMFFDSTRQIQNERISICQMLRELDEENEEIYSNEIKEITQKQIINKGLREIEKSKIYVDVEGIKKAMKRRTIENFKRYQSLVEANIKDETPHFITLEEGIEESEGRKLMIVMPSDERRQLFNQIVFDLRDSFVSSNEYGLDGYLSVGIRHGTLSGQLRAPLEEKNLITQKDSITGEYQLSSFWKKDKLDEKAERKITIILDKFGKSIDYEIDKLKNKWIQIKTETNNNSEGLFNFQMGIDELIELEESVLESTTYEEIIDMIFDKLWEKTDKSLRDIREKINKDLINEFNRAFDTALMEIDKLKHEIEVTDLREQIISSKTNMQYELDKIAEWFTRDNRSTTTSFSADIILDIVYELTKNIYNNQEIKLEKQIDNMRFDGDKLKSFVDVMFILFDNIIKHSGLNGEIQVNVSIEKRNNHLIINCINEISDQIITTENREKIERIKKNINKEEDLSFVSKEGGTGFYKIKKIITVDVGCPLKMNFEYSEGSFIVELDIESKEIFI
ncbi:histidine kinase [Marinilactibacillus psychrotolerans]|uniref:hypothetical protein n=1 Tax=Marinilactibacillus psychrotolerans TaxID=191770 RepID=UPI00388BB0A1